MRRDDGWRGLRRVFRLPFPWNRHRVRDAVSDELRFHIEGRIEDLMTREHLSRADAEREAQRRFGDLDAYGDEMSAIDLNMHRRYRRIELGDTIQRELRQTFRALRRSPSFSLIVVATLALGLAASTTIFTMLDRIVLRPLPYPHGDRLIYIGTLWPGLHPPAEYKISRHMYFKFREAKSIANLGVYREDIYALPGGDGHDAERVAGVEVSASLFGVLGIVPEVGTLFSSAEELPARSDVVLLAHGLWTRRFGADRSIVGKSIDVGGRMLRVIGVLPATARLPDSRAELWSPLHLSPTDQPANNHVFAGVAMLASGATVERALAEVRAITARIVADNPRTYGERFMKNTGFAIFARPLRDEVVGPRVGRALWIAFASVGLVLLVAAANVGNLFLVRIEARRREVAVRTALGADRVHLATHYLGESMVLAGAAAALSTPLAYALLKIVLAFAPADLPRLNEVSLDWRGVAFCIVAAGMVGLVFGLVPLLRTTLDLSALREGGRGLGRSRARNVARRALAVSQVALAVLLLASAGLMLKSFQRLRSVRAGFDPIGVVSMRLLLPQERYRDDQPQVAFWHELYRRVEAIPGVKSVGATEALPLLTGTGCSAIFAPDGVDATKRNPCVPTITVGPGYFATMRIGVRGHEPDWNDNEQGTGAMVVSRSLADRLWPGQDPIGKVVRYSAWRLIEFRVSGVAEDVRALGLTQPPVDAAYFPIATPATAPPSPQADMDGAYLALVIRSTAPDLQSLATAVRRIVAEIDRRVPVDEVQTMESVVAKSTAQTSFMMLLLALSAGIALVLSAVGLYGVISYVVTQRRSEIGIRMALGAQRFQVSGLVVRQTLVMAFTGAVVGVGLSLLATRLLRALLFEVSPTDPVVLAAVPLVLLAVGVLASFAPARRAARVDPAMAIRAE